MNKRLVWNFELNNQQPLNLDILSADDSDELRWEARYFWPENSFITLYGLSDELLNFANYQVKHRQDLYYLLPDSLYNIKQRRLELLYKPLIKESIDCQGFGKKINLLEWPATDILPGTESDRASELIHKIKNNSQEIFVDKVAFIYKLKVQPTIKLELARLQIGELVCFSACIEGRSQKFVKLISKHLIGNQISCDYVRFLKQTVSHDE